MVLVTGAGRGLGRAVALACAAHGATVALLGRKPEALTETYDAIVAAGGREPAAIPLDLATAGDREFETLAGMLRRDLGRLDALVHCAVHFTPLVPLRDQPLEQCLDAPAREPGRALRPHARLPADAGGRPGRRRRLHRRDPRLPARRLLGRVRRVEVRPGHARGDLGRRVRAGRQAALPRPGARAPWPRRSAPRAIRARTVPPCRPRNASPQPTCDCSAPRAAARAPPLSRLST